MFWCTAEVLGCFQCLVVAQRAWTDACDNNVCCFEIQQAVAIECAHLGAWHAQALQLVHFVRGKREWLHGNCLMCNMRKTAQWSSRTPYRQVWQTKFSRPAERIDAAK